jgi:hypothetical protein
MGSIFITGDDKIETLEAHMAKIEHGGILLDLRKFETFVSIHLADRGADCGVAMGYQDPKKPEPARALPRAESWTKECYDEARNLVHKSPGHRKVNGCDAGRVDNRAALRSIILQTYNRGSWWIFLKICLNDTRDDGREVGIYGSAVNVGKDVVRPESMLKGVQLEGLSLDLRWGNERHKPWNEWLAQRGKYDVGFRGKAVRQTLQALSLKLFSKCARERDKTDSPEHIFPPECASQAQTRSSVCTLRSNNPNL